MTPPARPALPTAQTPRRPNDPVLTARQRQALLAQVRAQGRSMLAGAAAGDGSRVTGAGGRPSRVSAASPLVGQPASFARALASATARSQAPVAGTPPALAPARSLPTAPLDPSPAGGLPRVYQGDPKEYDSAAQHSTWRSSTCSAASLTAVLRGRGLPVRIADVMRAMPGGMTPELGLVSRPRLVNAAARFGLSAHDEAMTYDALRQAVAAGQPVLVDVTNARFPEGHWMVVTGADTTGVRLADSSGYNLTHLTHAEFLNGWSRRGIRITNAPLATTPGARRG